MIEAPVTYIVPAEVTSPKFGRAFSRGCGGHVTRQAALERGPVALFGSPARWAMLQQAIGEQRDWYYGDHGYFGRRLFFRITKNAYQHDGSGTAGPDRFRTFGLTVQPWRSSGAHVLVCPNSRRYFGLFGIDVHVWVSQVETTLRAHTDREIRIRWKTDTRPIASDLHDAWAVVVFSSNAAVDALAAGVPVFVLAPFAAAYRMGSSDLTQIEAPRFPSDREPFMWNLAANQWTMHEISSGAAWRALCRASKEDRAAA